MSGMVDVVPVVPHGRTKPTPVRDSRMSNSWPTVSVSIPISLTSMPNRCKFKVEKAMKDNKHKIEK